MISIYIKTQKEPTTFATNLTFDFHGIMKLNNNVKDTLLQRYNL